MSVETSRGAPERAAYTPASYDGRTEEGRGGGWILFAGLMLGIVGIMNVIGGIAAIDDANVYVGHQQFTFGNLDTWGWVLLITGVVQGLAAVGIFVGNQFARWLGVAFASLNMLAQFLFLPAFPLWSIALIAVDTLIIYGLVAYGSREPAA